MAEEEVGSPGDEETKRQSKVDTLLAEVHSEKEVKKELDEELKLATAPYKESERKLAMAKRAKSEVAGQLKKAERELQNAHDQIAANAESAESEEFRLKSALKQTEEECAAARSNTDELKENQSQWLRSYEEIAPHVQDAKSKVEDLKHQLRGVRNTVASLQSSTGQDSLALLGPRVAKLADLVRIASANQKQVWR